MILCFTYHFDLHFTQGGIFIKQMIVDAWECGKAVLAPIWQQSRGILFYSVPHRGSPLADFNLPLLRQSIELTEIKKSKWRREVEWIYQ